MRILGVIAEYNPFHNGHKYHIEKSREALRPDYTVAVMSGNFVQRGTPAIMDKWQRSRHAVQNGIDAVFELPFFFACNRAEIFAEGGVELLAKIGVTDISFGSESGDINKLIDGAESITKQQVEIEDIRRKLMKDGTSFAWANGEAVRRVLGDDIGSLICRPNNILAIEYIKAISQYSKAGVNMPRPFTLKRSGDGYHGFDGASSIRQMVYEGNRSYLSLLPENVGRELDPSMDKDKTSQIAFEIIRSEIIKKTPEELKAIYCMGEGLENRLKKEVISCHSIGELAEALVSKRYTRAAVRRLLTYILLGINRGRPNTVRYGRILAANEKGRELIKTVKRENNDDFFVLTNINKEGIDDELLQMDILASDMYNIICNRDLYGFSDKVMKPFMC